MVQKGNFIKVLNELLKGFSIDAIRICLRNPSYAYFFFRTLSWLRKAERVRSHWGKKGIHIPPILIISVTNRCNLRCKGCYNSTLRKQSITEMSTEELRRVIWEAGELGVSFIGFVGGEPLIRKEILDILEDFPRILFLMVTNGLLIDEKLVLRLKRRKNIIPIISLEGYQEDTDGRRGKGVYDRLQGVIRELNSEGIFFSLSLTVTRSNFDIVTDDYFVRNLIVSGCKLLFFVEYTPVKEGTEDWIITDDQRIRLLRLIKNFRLRHRGLFSTVPGDEEKFGGCLSAGRGFIHISAEGNLEPCPFAPYSDVNISDFSLKEALQSKFLKAIRDNHGYLKETNGGCALWKNRDWLRYLLTHSDDDEPVEDGELKAIGI